MDRAAGDPLGLYISIPFCRSKCTYCNFASGVYPASDHARYVERLIEDLAAARPWAEKMGAELGRRVDTVYLGGGTPNLLEPDLLKRLFGAIRSEFALDADAEITMECAPGQFADGTLEAMVECGVNRVSLGVQTFDDREAHISGRLHTKAMVDEDIRRLRAAGITNLNIDLIAGLAGQTFASWKKTLDALIESDVPHASVYMLEVDEESRLGHELLAGGKRFHADVVPTDDAMARMYERAIERLDEVGIKQYEISNFCRPEFHSRHNLRYWTRKPYLGLGLDASSALFDRRDPAETFLLRDTTTADLKEYLAGPQPVETSWLAAEQQHEETWFLGLRLNTGVHVTDIKREFGEAAAAAAMERAERLSEAGLVEIDGDRVRLTARGRLISNDVFQEFVGLTTGMHH